MNVSKSRSKGSKDVLERIAEACQGLNFVSETDSDVRPLFLGPLDDISPASFGKVVAQTAGATITERDAGGFFAALTKARSWQTPAQARNAKRFAELEKLLNAELQDLRVFRVGRVRIDIYVVGRDAAGNWLGVKTHAVET